MEHEEKRRIVREFLGKQILLSPEMHESLSALQETTSCFDKKDLLYVNEDVLRLLRECSNEHVNWQEFEKTRVYTPFFAIVARKV